MSEIIKKQPELLTLDQALQLAATLARIEELKTKPVGLSIVKPDGENANESELAPDAEQAALIEHVAGTLLAHAGELIGCFVAVQQEYSPLVRALIPIVQRIQHHTTPKPVNN